MSDSLLAWQRGILDAAEERDWVVLRLDAREGVVLEEPDRGLTIRIVGVMLSPDFIRRMPLGYIRPARTMADDSPCWCRFDNLDGHESKCGERRELARPMVR